MVKRESVNLGDRIDFDLSPKPPSTLYWLKDGPSADTQVEVPQGTERVFVAHPPDEVSLDAANVLPRIAIYELDLNMRGGGFNVLRYVCSVASVDRVPLPPSIADA